MIRFAFDSILLFALVIPFIMAVRISPGNTPYWLFGIIFLGLLSYLILDVIKIAEKKYILLKDILLWGIIILVLGSSFASAIIFRHITHPIYQIHDMPLQQEIAIRYLLDGKNPYATTYFGTILEQWHYSDTEINPALYHFVLPPFYIIFALPFYFLSNQLLGYFDARIPLLFLFFVLLFIIAKLIHNPEKRRIFLSVLAFHPAMLLYTLEGRSDIFMFGFLALGLFLLHKEKYIIAGIPMALAFAVKQSVWPIFPFYVAFLYFKTKNFQKTIFSLFPFVITFAFAVLPFFFWDKKAFIESTVLYLSGSTGNSYPISGYGFGSFLHQIGVIKDVGAYYPFTIWQLVISLPILIFLYKLLKKIPTVSMLIFCYGIFLFIFWYFSRYFNNSHVAYLSFIFITAYAWQNHNEK